MGSKNKKSSDNKNDKSEYLEIFIQEDGRLIFSPLTDKSVSVFKAISDNHQNIPNPYCG
jgi:hypothetical protein